MPNENLKEFLKELKNNNQIEDFTIENGSVVLNTKRNIDITIPMKNASSNGNNEVQ